jgi:hypothetical protein
MSASFQRSTPEVLEAIHQVLAPYVGRLMARTAASAHCRDLGIDSAVMSRPQIESLLDKLGLGLIIFLGKEKTSMVVESMRRAIDSLGAAL